MFHLNSFHHENFITYRCLQLVTDLIIEKHEIGVMLMERIQIHELNSSTLNHLYNILLYICIKYISHESTDRISIGKAIDRRS